MVCTEIAQELANEQRAKSSSQVPRNRHQIGGLGQRGRQDARSEGVLRNG